MMRTSAALAMAVASMALRGAGTPMQQAKAEAYGMDLAAFMALPKHGGGPPRSRPAGWRQKRRRKLARQFDTRGR